MAPHSPAFQAAKTGSRGCSGNGAAFAAAAVEPSSFERLFDGSSLGESLLAAVSAGGAMIANAKMVTGP